MHITSYLYIINDKRLYRQRITSILLNLFVDEATFMFVVILQHKLHIWYYHTRMVTAPIVLSYAI